MQRSSGRNATGSSGSNRRAAAVIVALMFCGGVFAMSQVAASATTGSSANTKAAASAKAKKAKAKAAASSAPVKLEVLAKDCDKSKLEKHDGFQKGDRCVTTEFGELSVADQNPSLLITGAPKEVTVKEAFALKVSTRNLVRDRFLKAGDGGYFLESSILNDDGLVRGHFHTACRMLDDLKEAPEPDPVPGFFVATEDKGGSDTPDEVTVQVTGLPEAGVAQCAVWAGDGSHRIPMMERANQTPAFDVIRINVTA